MKHHSLTPDVHTTTLSSSERKERLTERAHCLRIVDVRQDSVYVDVSADDMVDDVDAKLDTYMEAA